MGRSGVGIDIGSESIRVVWGQEQKELFCVKGLLEVPLSPEAFEDPHLMGSELRAALTASKVKGDAFCGVSGRDLVVRYTQVPPVPDWQLRQLMDFEIKEMVDQSGEALAADFNLIPVSSDVSSDDTVLLALAKMALLDHYSTALKDAGVKVRAFSPNSIALYNAYRKTASGEGTVLLVDIGSRNTDLVIVRDGDLVFARNMTGGGSLLDDALVASFNVSPQKARKLKEEMADVSPFDSATSLSRQEEKVARAASGAIGQILSMVQSSVTFARSQTGVNDIELDRVALCGGGSRLRGIDRYLSSNLGVPVDLFDPFDSVDVTAIEQDLDDGARSTSVVALGLAMAGASDDVYSIEILPPSLKKSRDFGERTVFSVMAAALVLLFLFYDAWQSRSDSEIATQEQTKFSRELKKRTNNLRDYETNLQESTENSLKLALLEERIVAGVGLERTLGLVQRYLPEDLYCKSVELERIKDPDLGIPDTMKPVVVVKGEGREGAEGLEKIFNRFAQNLARDPLLPHTPKTKTSPAGPKKPFEWSITMNFSEPVAADGVDEGEPDDGSE